MNHINSVIAYLIDWVSIHLSYIVIYSKIRQNRVTTRRDLRSAASCIASSHSALARWPVKQILNPGMSESLGMGCISQLVNAQICPAQIGWFSRSPSCFWSLCLEGQLEFDRTTLEHAVVNKKTWFAGRTSHRFAIFDSSAYLKCPTITIYD